MDPKVVLITGCSSGIGLASAVHLAKDDEKRFKVYATMRNLSTKEKLEEEVEGMSCGHIVYQAVGCVQWWINQQNFERNPRSRRPNWCFVWVTTAWIFTSKLTWSPNSIGEIRIHELHFLATICLAFHPIFWDTSDISSLGTPGHAMFDFHSVVIWKK